MLTESDWKLLSIIWDTFREDSRGLTIRGNYLDEPATAVGLSEADVRDGMLALHRAGLITASPMANGTWTVRGVAWRPALQLEEQRGTDVPALRHRLLQGVIEGPAGEDPAGFLGQPYGVTKALLDDLVSRHALTYAEFGGGRVEAVPDQLAHRLLASL